MNKKVGNRVKKIISFNLSQDALDKIDHFARAPMIEFLGQQIWRTFDHTRTLPVQKKLDFFTKKLDK